MNVTRIFNRLVEAYSLIPYHLFKGYSLPPVAYQLYVTRRCNLRCSFCFFLVTPNGASDADLQREELSFHELCRLVDELPKLGLLTFTGGEPFMRPDMVDLLSYSSRRRRSHIITNGSLVPAREIPRIISLGSRSIAGRGLVLLGVSVPGLERAHERLTGVPGAFGRTMETLQRLVAEKRRQRRRYPLINMKTVITPHSLPELVELYRLAIRTGTDIFNVLAEYSIRTTREMNSKEFDMLEEHLETPENLDIHVLKDVLEELQGMSRGTATQLRITPPQVPVQYIMDHYAGRVDLSKYYCHSPWAKVEISPYGDVYPCLEYVAGNIREEPFMKIWNGTRFREFRRRLKQKGLFKACQGCCNMEIKPGCEHRGNELLEI
ncbi:radical SAM protein [bacterium]|nr:radical SAM protein [candidate division CSSED10-310 bacterium]